jgi:hypothetical protein
MLSFYGFVGKNVSILDSSRQNLQNTLTDNGTYKYNSIVTDDIFLAFSDYTHWSQPLIHISSEKVFVLATGHLYEWSDGHPNSSDKELCQEVLRVYLEHGITALQGCKGKFSIVIIDQRYESPGKVFLLKDRLGYSPLYYNNDSDGISFASRAESIGVSGIYRPQLNADAIAQAFCLGVVFEGLSLFNDVHNLTGGKLLTFYNGKCSITDSTSPLLWPEEPANHYLDCVNALAESTLQAVRRVGLYCKKPIRFFLSGGADSRLILNCLLRQGQNFYAVTEYEFQENEPDVLTAKALQEAFGFTLRVEKSHTREQEVTSNMLGRIYAHEDRSIFTIKGFGDPRNWFKPMEVKSQGMAEKAFGAISPFTVEFMNKLTCDLKTMSDKYIDRRSEKTQMQKIFTHNMANLFGTFLRSTETDSHARPQNRFLGTLHIPYLDEDAVTATADIPPMLPSKKIKLFTEVIRRHFPEHPDVPIIHKFMTKKHQAMTSKVGETGENIQCKMAIHDHDLYNAYEMPARKILKDPANGLLGNIISENCLEAPFFPPQFSLSVIFWDAWKKLYFPSF